MSSAVRTSSATLLFCSASLCLASFSSVFALLVVSLVDVFAFSVSVSAISTELVVAVVDVVAVDSTVALLPNYNSYPFGNRRGKFMLVKRAAETETGETKSRAPIGQYERELERYSEQGSGLRVQQALHNHEMYVERYLPTHRPPPTHRGTGWYHADRGLARHCRVGAQNPGVGVFAPRTGALTNLRYTISNFQSQIPCTEYFFAFSIFHFPFSTRWSLDDDG